MLNLFFIFTLRINYNFFNKKNKLYCTESMLMQNYATLCNVNAKDVCVKSVKRIFSKNAVKCRKIAVKMPY